MKPRANVFNSLSLASRSLSRSARARAVFQNVFGRFIAGVATLAVVVAAQSSEWRRPDVSLEAFRSASTVQSAAVLSPASHRSALESRSPGRSATGSDAALPAFSRALSADGATHGIAILETTVSRSALVVRGYDATAPPPLS